MLYFYRKMHQKCDWWPGSARTSWGSLQRSPRSSSWIKRGLERRRGKREGRRKGKERGNIHVLSALTPLLTYPSVVVGILTVS